LSYLFWLVVVTVGGAWAFLPYLRHHCLHQGVIWLGPSGNNRIALTFDDGPDDRYTPEILAILAKYSIKATFFIIGEQALKNEKIVQQIVAGGHELGIHGFRHRRHWFLSPKATKRDIELCQESYERLVGYRPSYYRPPWGIFNTVTYQTAINGGNQIVLWSLDSRDWCKGQQGPKILKRIMEQVRDGSIVLLHDGGPSERMATMVKVLPEVIEKLMDRGYKPLLLSELIK
jgi:peptidoglycan/xylan/chitin deacetylase (PgdA/CDA1 family)